MTTYNHKAELHRLAEARRDIPYPPEPIPLPTPDEQQRLARRLSGALGRHVEPDAIDWTRSMGTILMLADGGGSVYLHGDRGNLALVDGETWVRDGRALSEDDLQRVDFSDG